MIYLREMERIYLANKTIKECMGGKPERIKSNMNFKNMILICADTLVSMSQQTSQIFLPFLENPDLTLHTFCTMDI